MIERIFVDTNVLVYAYEAGHPAKQSAAALWLERLWREQSGRTSAQVLNELYVTLTRKLAHRMSSDEAWDVTSALMAWNPQAVDRELLLKAREVQRRYRTSWWDGLIVAAAMLQECDLLLSEDLQHGMRFESVTVHNPFATAVQEPRPAYPLRESLPPLHRPRGRPRKKKAPQPA